MRREVGAAIALVLWAASAGAQTISQRGIIEGRGFVFPQTTSTDAKRGVGDALFREEVFLRPSDRFQVAAGLDLRANSYHQVEDKWRLDWEDRGLLRPRAAIRRLSATVSGGGFTLDVGKQFIRWGRADVIYPTDRFAPRDYVNVVDSELLPVLAARTSIQIGSETLEGVWVPQLTPSRLPLLNQRWTVLPEEATGLAVSDLGSAIPRGSQFGVRWRHTGPRLETALEFFDGFNHLPNLHVIAPPSGAIELTRTYPAIRMYGTDMAVPTRLLTLKLEAAYVQAPTSETEEYVLYVVEIERQIGEWLVDVGYAGDAVTKERAVFSFAPDRGMARSVIGRASYTVDPRRTITIEGAARQDGDGLYGKIEYSQAIGRFLRFTATGVGLAGDEGDFLGQYRHNSHGSVSLRVTF